jgi:hypothetical protein
MSRGAPITADEVRARRQSLGLSRSGLYEMVWDLLGLQAGDNGRTTVYHWERPGAGPPAWVSLALDVLEAKKEAGDV